jgi:hypothetical protein
VKGRNVQRSLFTDILDDACGKMIPNTQIGPSRGQESTWDDRAYRETIPENFVLCKNIAVDESTVGFKCKIIPKIYNPKRNQPNGKSDYLY